MKACALVQQVLTMPSRVLPHSSLLHPEAPQHSDPQPLQQQRQRQHQQQRHNQLLMDFRHAYYLKDDIGHLDIVFYTIHLAMSAVHKRLLVTSRQQLGFEFAMSLFAGALLMRLFFKPLYTRVRPTLVFSIHVLLTFIRAGVVLTMASKQAVHFRPASVFADDNRAGVTVFVTTMLGVLGGPFRLFEMAGLQQPWTSHAIVAVLYLLLHPLAAADGIRLACSNALFYQVHAVHDAVAAFVDGLLDIITGMPLGQQRTCSSCAGVAIYGFMCLFASFALPLYVMYVWELGAQQRWLQQAGAAAAAAAAAAGDAGVQPVATGIAAGPHAGSSSNLPAAAQHSSGAGSTQQGPLAADPCLQPAAGASRAEASAAGSAAGRGITRLEAICRRAEAVAAEQRLACAHVPSLRDLLTSDIGLVRWGTHLAVLLSMLVLCWLVSNGLALVVLPRLLSPWQLQRWCPNRPLIPYVIAGEVYHGL